jgi:hypothetical protein
MSFHVWRWELNSQGELANFLFVVKDLDGNPN